MSNDIFARCMAISMSHFLNTPYKEQTITEMYAHLSRNSYYDRSVWTRIKYEANRKQT